jgi:transcriptional regulator with XRE-family HTH domain
MNLTEIGLLVRQRRVELGLSQDRLAKLADLSRATINQLETGALVDLGVAKLAALLNTLGLQLQALGAAHVPPGHGLLMASRTASVSYKTPLQARQLAKAMASGHLPAAIAPHVATLLDEAPMPLIVRAVEEAAAGAGIAPKQVWQHVLRWAHQSGSPRVAWI